MHKHPIHLIKKDKTYTSKELAATLRVHVRTIQKWHGKGMPALPNTFPLLFKGEAVKAYLLQKRKKQKQPLQADEFLCMHCHAPRRSVRGCVQIVSGCQMGKFQQYRITGKCETCGTKISRLVTNKTPEVLAAMKQYQSGNQNITEENSQC